DSTEALQLSQDILIHVTRFFRDPDSFQALTTEVFPDITASRASDTPIRIWVPGCSTGEEAYSVAISLLEHLGEEASSIPTQLFPRGRRRAATRPRGRRRPPTTHRGGGPAGAPAPLLLKERRQPPNPQGRPRPLRLPPPGPRPGSAVLEARSRRLPKRAHL